MIKLQDEDFLYSFFLAPGGTTIWIHQRNDEIFVQAILNNSRRVFEHWPATRQGAVNEVIRSYSILGFQEMPVYQPINKRSRKENGNVKYLIEQFNIYDAALQAESAKRVKEQEAKEQEAKEQKAESEQQ